VRPEFNVHRRVLRPIHHQRHLATFFEIETHFTRPGGSSPHQRHLPSIVTYAICVRSLGSLSVVDHSDLWRW
jgi:hypothetical protein